MDLIPGLPNDLARECLIRLPFGFFSSVLPVCKAWNTELRSPDFHQRRKLSGLIRPVFIISQRDTANLSQCLFAFDPELWIRTRLPLMPDMPFGCPKFCGVVDVGLNNIVVIFSGWVQLSCRSLRYYVTVHLFDFLTGQWRRATDIPGPGEWFGFAVTADPIRRKVLVAGGYSGRLRALGSAVMYDVASDTWMCLADMAKERKSCSVVFNEGRFHVIGGYGMNLSHRYMRCSETLDPETLLWYPINEEFLEEGFEFCRVVANGEGHLYSVDDNVRTRRRGGEERWEDVAKVPDDIWLKECVVTWKDKMLVIGSGRTIGGPSYTYLLDLKSYEWSNVDLMDKYSTLVIEKGCGMDL